MNKEITEINGLSTAFRMFMVRSKAIRGLPFPAVMTSDAMTHAEAVDAFARLRAEAADVSEMSLDEINAEISEARAKGKAGR